MVEARRSAGRGDPLAGGGDDLREPLGRFQAGERGGFEPVRLGQFLVERDFAVDPSCRKGQDDEMPFNPSFGIANDRLAVAGKTDRLDVKRQSPRGLRE